MRKMGEMVPKLTIRAKRIKQERDRHEQRRSAKAGDAVDRHGPVVGEAKVEPLLDEGLRRRLAVGERPPVHRDPSVGDGLLRIRGVLAAAHPVAHVVGRHGRQVEMEVLVCGAGVQGKTGSGGERGGLQLGSGQGHSGLTSWRVAHRWGCP